MAAALQLLIDCVLRSHSGRITLAFPDGVRGVLTASDR
jgi:hypothetical protein